MKQFRSIRSVCSLMVGLCFVSAVAKDKVTKPRVEIAHTEKAHCQSLGQATVTAFATLAGQIRLDRPLFVTARKATNGFIVELFSVLTDESSNSLSERTKNERRLAIVRIDEDISFEVKTKEVGFARTIAHYNVIAAVAFWEAAGSISPSFEINSRTNPSDQYLVDIHVVRFPPTPGAQLIIEFSKTRVRILPGA